MNTDHWEYSDQCILSEYQPHSHTHTHTYMEYLQYYMECIHYLSFHRREMREPSFREAQFLLGTCNQWQTLGLFTQHQRSFHWAAMLITAWWWVRSSLSLGWVVPFRGEGVGWLSNLPRAHRWSAHLDWAIGTVGTCMVMLNIYGQFACCLACVVKIWSEAVILQSQRSGGLCDDS